MHLIGCSAQGNGFWPFFRDFVPSKIDRAVCFGFFRIGIFSDCPVIKKGSHRPNLKRLFIVSLCRRHRLMESKRKHSTAILVFANSSNEELRFKKFAAGGRLFDALTKQTLRTVRKTGIPFFHITEHEQRGNSFGERFTNAIRTIFDEGHENIITVGNDSPHLTQTHLLNTLTKLEQGESVIGPSADGGFYLMGLHRPDFEKNDFEELSWQTAHIREEIMTLLTIGTKEVHLLPILFDLDTIWDAQIMVKHTAGLVDIAILNAIRSIVSTLKKLDYRSFFFVQRVASEIFFNKGSPVYSFS